MTRPEDRWGHRLRDPTVLRALAHPSRLQMLDVLHETGGATATQCSAVVGLTPSACSWHLRLLARAGVVEDAGVGQDGRERRWRSRIPRWQVDLDDIEADAAEARSLDMAVTQALLDASDRAVQTFTAAAARSDEPPEWRAAALVSNSTLRITAEELSRLSEAISDLMNPYTLRSRPDPIAGARVVHAGVRLAPLPPHPPADRPDDGRTGVDDSPPG